MLPRQRIVPLLVDAFDEVGPSSDSEMVEELLSEAPEHVHPWGTDWKTWLVERYFAPFLSE